MLTRVPFAMTSGAAAFVRSQLQDVEPWLGPLRWPFLVRIFGWADGLTDGVWYEGEHFHLVHREEWRWDLDVVALFGHQVYIEPNTLRRLTNRILALHTVAVEHGEPKYVLVCP
jgi:hypothetical protein